MHNHYTKTKDGFAVQMGQLTRPPMSPLEEFELVADDMKANDITVLLSGGIDSEAIYRLLHKVGKKVTGVAYRLMFRGTCINEHDLKWLDKMPGNIRCEVLDVEKFWTSDWYMNFMENHYCPSPQLAIQAYMTLAQSLNQYTVLPAIHPEPKLWDRKTHIQIREKDFAVSQFLANQNCMVSPLQHTPEMYASLLQSSEFQLFDTFGLQDGRTRKVQQYKEWFDLDLEARPKYHGFEQIKEVDNAMRQFIWEECGYEERWMFIPIATMLKDFEEQYKIYNTNTEHKIFHPGPYLL